MEDSHSSEIADCLRSLCGRLAIDKENAYRFAVSYLAEDTMRFPLHDEQLLAQRIQAKLLKTKTSREANLFAECHQKLKSSILFKDRVSLLAFFYALAPSQRDAEFEKRNTAARDLTLAQMSLHSPSSFDDILPSAVTSETQSVHPSHILYPQPISGLTFGSSSQPDSMNKTSTMSRFSSQGPTASSVSAKLRSSSHTYKSTSLDSIRKHTSIYDGDLSEHELLQDVIFTIQGVRGRLNMTSSALPRPRAALLLRLAELGFLHDRLKEFTDAASGYMPHGLVGEGLVSALRNELTEYYRSIAILQSQLSDGQNTLRRLVVWSVEPLHRLKWLTTVAHAAHTKKGGELASCVHRFASHGDPRVHNLAKHLLAAVCYPLYVMLSRWLLDGEIEDPFNEFFIETRSGVSIDRMWHDKYRVREPMLPSFITRQQAQQILATGKSVVFMREACGDAPDLVSGERDALKRVLDSNSVELLFSSSPETRLHAVMADAYYDASRRLLRALLTQHRLRDHLTAHRRYLLLAQGDFIHHLMRLIEPELNKSASQLHVHNLTCTLEAAVRATNAQYEQPDIIGRLYVNMFPSQPYDSGWDVFSLQYRVDGPLGTLFPAATAARYRALFTHLWRTTRMEHTLHAGWRTHTLQHKTLKDMPEVQSLLRRVSMLRAEAIRFCGELQHHCACGALEASWGALQAAIAAADCLDDVLAAHELFLTEVAVGAMLDDSTKSLQSYLGNVFEEMLILRTFEESLYARIGEERERRNHIENLKVERTNKGEFGITLAEEADNKEKIKIFQQYLVSRKADLNVLARSYRGHVKTFILKLALHNEVSLQTLAFRLDYNDFYKKGDSKLHEPLTYQHKRLSEVGISLVKSSSSNLIQRKRERPAERSTKRK